MTLSFKLNDLTLFSLLNTRLQPCWRLSSITHSGVLILMSWVLITRCGEGLGTWYSAFLSKQVRRSASRVAAFLKSGIRLLSILFVVGPKCLSTDEMFKAIEYKKMLEEWEKSKKERKKLVGERTLHKKGRVVESKATKTKSDYEKLLIWKMSADKFKKEGKGKNLDALNRLSEEYKDHNVVPIFVLGGQPSSPPVPEICETALGQASTRFLKQAIRSNIKNMDRSDILELRKELDKALTEVEAIMGIEDVPVESVEVSVG
jgi:hypothetical protein